MMSGFKSGLEILSERLSLSRMTTGDADLDSLLGGGIEPGQFYLFFGDRESGVDRLIHQLLVNTLLPPERYGLGGKCVYTNCGNYRDERTMLDTALLCRLIKAERLDPDKALGDIYTLTSFSEEQEERIFVEIEELLQKDQEIRLVAIHNIARLFTTERKGRNFGERIMRLQRLVYQLRRLCAERNVALVATCRPEKSGIKRLPRPEGGKYLSHTATIIVYLRRTGNTVSATLIKHPNRPGKKINLTGGDGLGRITLPFRIAFREELNNLKRTYREALMDSGRREAFDSLVKTWSSEQGAMSYARIPTVLEAMLLTAAIDNRKLIVELLEENMKIHSRLEKILEKLEGQHEIQDE